jgi:hypothetical protein
VGALLCEIREIITAAYGGRRGKVEHLEIQSDFFEIVLWKSFAGVTTSNYSRNLLITNALFSVYMYVYNYRVLRTEFQSVEQKILIYIFLFCYAIFFMAVTTLHLCFLDELKRRRYKVYVHNYFCLRKPLLRITKSALSSLV